jgi:uncharacterized LabA/DUF88 family protein
MNDLTAIPRPRVALLIDGDNLSHAHAGALIQKAAKHGALTVKRVYGNMATHPGWDAAPGFRCIHSGKGKNATDLLLAVEAMALMLTRQADILMIASSDGDFSHLAQHLTEAGHRVIGTGEAKAPDHFRKSCSAFVELSALQAVLAPLPTAAVKAPEPDRTILEILNAAPGQVMGLSPLGKEMMARGINIKEHGAATLSKYLKARPKRYRLTQGQSGFAVGSI